MGILVIFFIGVKEFWVKVIFIGKGGWFELCVIFKIIFLFWCCIVNIFFFICNGKVGVKWFIWLCLLISFLLIVILVFGEVVLIKKILLEVVLWLGEG